MNCKVDRVKNWSPNFVANRTQPDFRAEVLTRGRWSHGDVMYVE